MIHSFVTIYTTPFNNAKNTSDVVLQTMCFMTQKNHVKMKQKTRLRAWF